MISVGFIIKCHEAARRSGLSSIVFQSVWQLGKTIVTSPSPECKICVKPAAVLRPQWGDSLTGRWPQDAEIRAILSPSTSPRGKISDRFAADGRRDRRFQGAGSWL